MSVAHIYWFAHYNMLGPCTRYRGKYVLEGIYRLYNIPYSFVYPSLKFKQFLKFVFVYLGALFFRKKNSIIVFQKTYTIGLYSSLLKILLTIRNNNTYYDIDDAYYVKFPPETINYFLTKCRTVITGSQSLALYAIKYSSNIDNVFTLSSPILDHRNIKTTTNEILTIGWSGFYNYHRDSLLQLLFPALKKLDFQIRLILLGVVKDEHFNEIEKYFEGFDHISIETPRDIDWIDEDEFYKKVMTFDVGVSPLLENEINIAKSAFKLKQYLSCGVPIIGSSTGENAIVLNYKINGFVANTVDEYFNCLCNFNKMEKSKRIQMGKNALESVQNFKIDNYCEKFTRIIKKTMK